MSSIEVKLSKPYTLAGKSGDTISFREPKLGDLIVVENVVKDGGSHGMTAVMMAQLSGATQPEIAEFSLADYAACDRALRPFMMVAEQGGGD
ncbi:MAG TPA: phage tail assembly protein [Mesorhizobium sp.]|jgi:hypothetical protein|uniref:phage tail assembly protein n=1 Tax=Mesorhizobium sp. TaxID=1871066 RepID=UPI002DDDBC01|nr:phage tail assembly protein [Mesorhizobium sp.]HEV2504391.1 phage tail assembly protein [Mesorhizobium sp.]